MTTEREKAEPSVEELLAYFDDVCGRVDRPMDVVPTTIGEMVANGPSTFSMPPPKFDGEMLY